MGLGMIQLLQVAKNKRDSLYRHWAIITSTLEKQKERIVTVRELDEEK